MDLVTTAAERHRLDGFLVVGGNGSPPCARDLGRDGVHCTRNPKTHHNSIDATEVTFGVDPPDPGATAASARLHTPAH